MADTSPWMLILGAKSDIARAIAHQFAQSGYNLYLAARQPERLEADVSDYQIRYEVEAKALAFDAIAYDSHEAFYAAITPRPQVVCCVFGFMAEQEVAEKDWPIARQMMEVNYYGGVSILHHIANDMEATGEGTIIGISSVAGDRGRGSNTYYTSSKAGFTAFLAGLRNRLAKKGVHVLTVKPGFVNTAMTEGMDLPPLLTASPAQVAKDVFRAAKKKRNVVYTKWLWRYIMFIIQHIPEGIFKKLNI